MFILQIVIPQFTETFVLNEQAFFEPWRFLTAIFLHGDLTHILFNMFALVLFGLVLESIIGSKKFVLVYFSSGIIGNLISVNFYSSSLGASGAIYGILGALAILRPLMTVFAFNIPMPMFLAAILWAVGDVLQTIFPSTIGTIAHLTGLFVGLIFGIFFRISKKYAEEKRIEIKYLLPEHEVRNWEERFMK